MLPPPLIYLFMFVVAATKAVEEKRLDFQFFGQSIFLPKAESNFVLFDFQSKQL